MVRTLSRVAHYYYAMPLALLHAVPLPNLTYRGKRKERKEKKLINSLFLQIPLKFVDVFLWVLFFSLWPAPSSSVKQTEQIQGWKYIVILDAQKML